MRFLLVFLLISTTAFAKDKIYTCKPVAAAVVMETGQTYSETLDKTTPINKDKIPKIIVLNLFSKSKTKKVPLIIPEAIIK